MHIWILIVPLCYNIAHHCNTTSPRHLNEMIKLQNLSYGYNRKVKTLQDITAEIGSGIHLLVGENGAGKTTLLHFMVGLRYPRSGSCELDGTPMRQRHPSEMCRVQFFGDGMEFPASTIKEMVKVHSTFFPRFDHEMLKRNLHAFGINENDKFSGMSLGTRRKAHLSYMLALRCDALLLDEPTNGLDINSKQTFSRMLVECVSPEQTVIVSTHTPADLESLYDSIIVLSHGKLLLNMNIDEITSHIAFVTQNTTDADILYSEPSFGLQRCIIANTDKSIESQLDFELLYNALHGNSIQAILNCLKS